MINPISYLWQKVLNRTRQKPKIMTDEEISELKKPLLRKQIFRWVLFLLGLACIYFGIFFLINEITIEGFEFTLNYEDLEEGVNISFVFGMIIMAIGAWFLSRLSLNTNKLRQNTTYIPHLSLRREPLLHQSGDPSQKDAKDFVKIRSFASSRLLAAIISFIVALVNMILFGIELTGENHDGNWLVLGGPSLFYPLSVFPIIISVGLLLYALFSSAIITFSKSQHFFMIEEHRFLAPWMTEILRSDVRAIRLTNGHTGARYLWIFVLGLHIIWLLVDGLYFLLNPFAFGNGLTAGWFYVGTALSQMIVLAILIVRHQTFLEILTDDKRYELQFSPPAAMPNVRGSIEEFFEMPALNEANRRFQRFGSEFDTNTNHDPRLPNRLVKSYRNLSIGIIYCLIALWTQLYLIYFGDLDALLGDIAEVFPWLLDLLNPVFFPAVGEPLRIILLMYGIFFMLKGIKEDFSSPRRKMGIIFDPNHQNLYIRKEWAWINSFYLFTQCTPENTTYEYRLNKLGFFETVLGFLIPVFIGIDLASMFYFVPESSEFTWFYINHYIADILIMLCLVIGLIYPINVLHVKTKYLDFEFPIPGTMSQEQVKKYKESNWFTRLFIPWITILKNQLKVVLIRSILMLLFLLFGFYGFHYLI